jgi:hypothetical protein
LASHQLAEVVEQLIWVADVMVIAEAQVAAVEMEIIVGV